MLIEKIPFFALIVPFSLLAYIAEGEAVNTSFPWNVKVSNAIVSYVIYIGKMIWPSNLAVFLSPSGAMAILANRWSCSSPRCYNWDYCPDSKEVSLPDHWMAVVCRHSGTCNRDSTNQRFWKGRPVYIYTHDRIVRLGSLGFP